MANSRSAAKRARQNIKRRSHNMAMRSKVRTYIKRVVTAIEAGNKSDAENFYKEALPVIDKMANNGILHKNKAARHKQRLNLRIRAL